MVHPLPFSNRPELWRTMVLSVLVLVCLSGCAGYRQTLEDCYALAKARDFDRALDHLEKSSLAKSDKNRLLYLMEKGLLLHRQGDYTRSNQALGEGDRLVEELFTRSLSAEGLSFVTNDKIIPYAGEDYESAYLNYYMALNYLELGEPAEALVECRRVDEKLNYYQDSHPDRKVFRESAFLRYLTGMIYEAVGDDNNAFVAYRKSLETYRDPDRNYGLEVPRSLWDRLLLAARRSGFEGEYEELLAQAEAAGAAPGEGETMVAVIVERGWIPVKREVFTLVWTEKGIPIKLAVPELYSRPCYVGPLEVLVNDEAMAQPEKVDDPAEIARRTLEERNLRVIAKATARAVAKEMAARKVEKEKGELAGLAVRLAAHLSEQADLRSWSSLPESVHLAAVPVDPGRHTIAIRSAGFEQRREVEVKKGSLAIVHARVE